MSELKGLQQLGQQFDVAMPGGTMNAEELAALQCMADGPDRFMRLPEVIEMVGLCKAMIYRRARAGTFPKPYKPGGASSRWSHRELTGWLQQVKAQT